MWTQDDRAVAAAASVDPDRWLAGLDQLMKPAIGKAHRGGPSATSLPPDQRRAHSLITTHGPLAAPTPVRASYGNWPNRS